jgi:hypothetical protein
MSSPSPTSSTSTVSEEENVHNKELDEIEEKFKELEQRLVKLKQLEYNFYIEDASYFNDLTALKKKMSHYQKSQLKRPSEGTSTTFSQVFKTYYAFKGKFNQLEQQFHRKPRFLLTCVLGSANFVMHSKHRLQYKTEYENFKLQATILHIIVCLFNIWLGPITLMDGLFHFLLLYYYSTTTLREHILLVNGSNIREWWLIHHYLSILLSAVLILWPSGTAFYQFRTQFYYFSTCIGIVQLLQFLYQMERLYTLRALSKVGPMDVTTDAASSHIRNLTFLLPFLVAIQLFQVYNGYILFRLAQTPEGQLWQIWASSILFTILGLGNFITTFLIYFEKTCKILRRRR